MVQLVPLPLLFALHQEQSMSTKTKEYNYGYEAGRRAGLEEAARRFTEEYSDLGTIALEELALLLSGAEGYIRIGWGRDETYYVRYKWTQGRLAGLYTLRSAKLLGEAVSSIVVAARQVETGAIKGTVDSPPRRK